MDIRSLSITLALLLLCVGCGESNVESDEPALDTATLAASGTYGAGSLDIELVDTSRTTPANGSFPGAPERRLPARVWFPIVAGSSADDPAPTSFPLIGYGHGFFSSRHEAQWIGPHLASHGYVLIAVDFPLSNGGAPGGATIADMANQPGDLAFVMAQVQNGAVGAGIAAIVDPSRRGIAGLSLGGATALIAAYHPKWHIENIHAAVAFAPASCFFGPGLYTRSLPFLIVTGDRDLLVHPEDGPRRAFADARVPITLATLLGGNHVGFLGIENTEGGNGDDIGCLVIGTGGANATAGFERLSQTLRESADDDVVSDGTPCLSTCTELFPQGMRALRQQELSRAATLAHFEAHLRGRRAAARWLEDTFDAQNDDVTVEIRE